MAEPQTDYLQPGQMFGEFRVVRRLGKGGMGMVYLVEHPESGRFAVKIVDPVKAAKDREYVRRFAREGRFARKHRHPNLIPVHDIGQDPDTGLYYLIMDYMPGGDIGQRLNRDGRFPVEEAVRIVAQVARALEAAHASGMVHRDIKPENIMFDADGTPKLADLGVAKFSDAGQTMLTSADVMIGTPAYMAPEQIMDSHGVDAQADVYSLGIVFFEMLTGKRPNEGLSVLEIVSRAVKGESIPDVRIYRPDVPDAVAHLLNAMCEPRRERRLTTRQTVTLLNRILAPSEGAAALPEAPPPPVPPEPRNVRTPTPAAQQALNHLPRLRAETPAPAPSRCFRLSSLRPLLAMCGRRALSAEGRRAGVFAAVALAVFLGGTLAGFGWHRVAVHGQAAAAAQKNEGVSAEIADIRKRIAEVGQDVEDARTENQTLWNRIELVRGETAFGTNRLEHLAREVSEAEKRRDMRLNEWREGRLDTMSEGWRTIVESARRRRADLGKQLAAATNRLAEVRSMCGEHIRLTAERRKLAKTLENLLYNRSAREGEMLMSRRGRRGRE